MIIIILNILISMEKQCLKARKVKAQEGDRSRCTYGWMNGLRRDKLVAGQWASPKNI